MADLTQSLIVANPSLVFVQAPAEKGLIGFAIDFLMGGVSGAVSRTVAAPIERDKDPYWKASGGFAGASSLVFVFSLDYARAVWLMTLRLQRRVVSASLTVLLMFTRRPTRQTVLLGYTVGSHFQLLDNFFASFALGWLITNAAGLASYPIDTVLRRMMMTSSEAVKYKNTFDALSQIVKKEGVRPLFKGGAANILTAVAGAVNMETNFKFFKVGSRIKVFFFEDLGIIL
ncbi:putative mitochondrial carrier protein [Helianthus annuus]|nr:putative mitochondrial carrier protein [Helianthus annuus]